MQKVQSYLYPNRVIVIADLAGFTVENTVVYAKTVKIYKGVDNVIQFDIQNADQKRLNLVASPLITSIKLNLMDVDGKIVGSSPYDVSTTSIQGITTVTIPADDIADITNQYLHYSITATNQNSEIIPLYTDSRFSAVGTIQVIGSAVPVARKQIIYDRFSGEINYMGNVIFHSSAVATKFYEADSTQTIEFTVHFTNFAGNLYIEGTKDSTISTESFRNADKIQTLNITTRTTGVHVFTVPIQGFNNLRVSWLYPDVWQYSHTGQDPTVTYGSIDKVIVTT